MSRGPDPLRGSGVWDKRKKKRRVRERDRERRIVGVRGQVGGH